MTAEPYTWISAGEIQATAPALPGGAHKVAVQVPGAYGCAFEQRIVASEDSSWSALKAGYR